MQNIISFGGGINSTAMILYMIRKEYIINHIIFADTGGERPYTYEYINYFNDFLKKYDLSIKIVKRDDIKYNSLEDECIKNNCLPSIAYGRFKSCSDKWKIQPQKKYINSILGDEKYYNYIGFTADEWKRIKYIENKRYINKFPLYDNDIDQSGCIQIIKEAGLNLPKKSSCFFCPNLKNNEVIELYKVYPHLYKRCIEMEENANLTDLKGLGRNKSFKDIIYKYENQLELFNNDDDNNNNYVCICDL